jgi:hypothetical protein
MEMEEIFMEKSKSRKFHRVMSMVLAVSLVWCMLSAMKTEVEAHELYHGPCLVIPSRTQTVRIRWAANSARVCVLRFGFDNTAATRASTFLRNALPHTITQLNTNTGGIVSASQVTATPNVLLRSHAVRPINIDRNLAAAASLRMQNGFYVTDAGGSMHPGATLLPFTIYTIDYAEIHTYPRFEDEPLNSRRAIVLHEAGHVLGLGHYPRTCGACLLRRSIMNSGTDPNDAFTIFAVVNRNWLQMFYRTWNHVATPCNF